MNDLRCIQPKQILQFRLLQRLFGVQTIPWLRNNPPTMKNDVILILDMLDDVAYKINYDNVKVAFH